VQAAARDPGNIAAQLKALKEGAVTLDGYKGQRLGFRAWDGQLRQSILLAHGNGVSDIAPLEGFLHPRSTLDTLGYDAPESACKSTP
jgi:ABC transporter substrate binding protein (PQQ-dependent alcohol dehydrogenase system)